MNSKPVSVKSESSELKKYPTIVRFDEDDLPALKSWKVGGKYQILLDVEQMSMSKGDEYGEDAKSEAKHRASFKVLSASVPGEAKKLPLGKGGAIADAMKRKIQ